MKLLLNVTLGSEILVPVVAGGLQHLVLLGVSSSCCIRELSFATATSGLLVELKIKSLRKATSEGVLYFHFLCIAVI